MRGTSSQYKTFLFFFCSLRIRSSAKTQQQLTSQTKENHRRETNMAIVLVCIVVMFIVCQSVKIVPDLWEALMCTHEVCVFLVKKKLKSFKENSFSLFLLPTKNNTHCSNFP